MFVKLGKLFVESIITVPAYTNSQLINRVLDGVKQTGLYTIAVQVWSGVPQQDKTWATFEELFVKAYELRLDSSPIARAAGYHGAAHTLSNDDSLGSITGSIAQMQMANNANAQVFLGNLSAISTSTNELRQALVATQQQLAVLAQAVQQPNDPPLAAFQPPLMQAAVYNAANTMTTIPNAYMLPLAQPPAQWNSTWCGGGRSARGRRHGYRCGRGGRGRSRRGVGIPIPAANKQSKWRRWSPTTATIRRPSVGKESYLNAQLLQKSIIGMYVLAAVLMYQIGVQSWRAWQNAASMGTKKGIPAATCRRILTQGTGPH